MTHRFEPTAAPTRKSFRYITNISVLAALLHKEKEKRLPGVVLQNISYTGAGILSPVALPIGESISLHFYLPENGLPFRAIASVIWSDSQGHCGLRFKQVSELHLHRLEVWLGGKLAEHDAAARAALPLGSRISEFHL
jgi:PilZ domain